MNVRDFLKQFKDVDLDLEVVLQQDDVGNDYRYANGAEIGLVIDDHGELDSIHEDDYADLDDEDKVLYTQTLIIY